MAVSYVFQLPYSVKTNLSSILDASADWEKLGELYRNDWDSSLIYCLPFLAQFLLLQMLLLFIFCIIAGLMKFTHEEVLQFRNVTSSGGSPTVEMLRAWGTEGHSTNNLFFLLRRLGNLRAMKVLLPYGV